MRVRGKAPPAPIETWEQAGLSDAVMAALSARGFAAPFAIQRQVSDEGEADWVSC